MSKIITENSISVEVTDNHANPTNAITFFNPVMRINREFVLACLGAYCNEREGDTKCLDAFSATGVCGLQWKHHVQFPVSITINDIDPKCVQNVKANCERNGFKVTEKQEVKPNTDAGGDGDKQPPSRECPLVVRQQDANVLLHSSQYNFIHCDPFGSTVQYLDAVFRNVYHRGIVVLTATDVASLYGKCPQVTKRNYSAYTVRTDYTKEMAVRILLAEAARSAGKCNKGFEVMYSVAVEHFVQVGLRIKRGANHANQCVNQISSYLHCLHCQEWGQMPDTHSPTESPYSHLPCTCQSEYPGHTAVILGPMWSGEIFQTEFLRLMSVKASQYKLSDRTQSLLTTLIDESQCLSHTPATITDQSQCSSHTPAIDTDQSKCLSQTSSDNNVNMNNETSEDSEITKKESENCEKSNSNDKTVELGNEQTLDKNLEKNSETVDSETMDSNSATTVVSGSDSVMEDISAVTNNKKRQNSEIHTPQAAKKAKTMRCYTDDQVPTFYYSLHKRKVKSVDVPKMSKLVTRLQRSGYRASRTGFDAHGVRTDATLAQLIDVLQAHFLQNK